MKRTILVVLSFWGISAMAATPGEILKEADAWIISDTARIMAYIDSCNRVTQQRLTASPYWSETYEQLAFLIGIDYLGQPQIDNTGRIYFTMRITGQIEHLFFVDAPGAWPRQLTPNSWAEEGLNISYFKVHPGGDYVLVGAMKYGTENHNIWLFARDGTFRPLLVDPQIEYSDVVFKSKDEFFLMVSTDTSRVLAKYSFSAKSLSILYRDPEWISIDDYRNGRLLGTRWFSFSESQLFVFDENTRKVKNITGRGFFANARFYDDTHVVCLSDALSGPEGINKVILVNATKPGRPFILYDAGMEIDVFDIVPTTGLLVALPNRDGYSELVLVDRQKEVIKAGLPGIGVVSGYRSMTMARSCMSTVRRVKPARFTIIGSAAMVLVRSER